MATSRAGGSNRRARYQREPVRPLHDGYSNGQSRDHETTGVELGAIPCASDRAPA
jgi:hypothetical protein